MSLSLFRAAFTCGVLSLMGLYHLMLYYQWREDARTLWFGVFCLLVTVRTFLIEAGPIGYLRLEDLTIIGSAWIALRYLNSVFGYLQGSWILRANSVVSVVLVVWVLLGPQELVRQQKWVLQLNLLAAFLVSLLYTYVLTNGGAVMGRQMAITSAVIAGLLVLFSWYSRDMARRGVLR